MLELHQCYVAMMLHMQAQMPATGDAACKRAMLEGNNIDGTTSTPDALAAALAGLKAGLCQEPPRQLNFLTAVLSGWKAMPQVTRREAVWLKELLRGQPLTNAALAKRHDAAQQLAVDDSKQRALNCSNCCAARQRMQRRSKPAGHRPAKNVSAAE